MKPSPAFQFYPNDWLSSKNIALMTPAEEGGYMRLLCHMWADENCSLEDDDEVLSVLSRLGEGWFKGGSTKVRKCFVPHPSIAGRITNVRLLKERKKQKEWREKSKAGGLKSGKIRANKTKGGSTTLRKGGSVLVEPKGNSSVFSLHTSVSNTNTQKRRTSRTANIPCLRWDEWWGINLVKKGKAAAFKAYEKAVNSGVPEEKLISALKRQNRAWKEEGKDYKYIPHPSTWLNQARWEDEVYEPAPADGLPRLSLSPEELGALTQLQVAEVPDEPPMPGLNGNGNHNGDEPETIFDIDDEH